MHRSQVAGDAKNYMQDLPSLEVGSYGRLAFAGRVVQVVGPEDVLLEMPEIGGRGVGFNTVIRLTGAPTGGFVDGAYAPDCGERIVIIGTTTYANASGSSTTVSQAVPMSVVRMGIPFSEFKKREHSK